MRFASTFVVLLEFRVREPHLLRMPHRSSSSRLVPAISHSSMQIANLRAMQQLLGGQHALMALQGSGWNMVIHLAEEAAARTNTASLTFQTRLTHPMPLSGLDIDNVPMAFSRPRFPTTA